LIWKSGLGKKIWGFRPFSLKKMGHSVRYSLFPGIRTEKNGMIGYSISVSFFNGNT